MATPFTEGVSGSAEGKLGIDETASTVILSPNLCAVPDLSVAVREREQCVQDFLDHLSGEENAACHLVLGGEADYHDSFVDIKGPHCGPRCRVGGLEVCGCAGSCEIVSGDVCRGCCRHISFPYILGFFLHSPIAYTQ